MSGDGCLVGKTGIVPSSIVKADLKKSFNKFALSLSDVNNCEPSVNNGAKSECELSLLFTNL